jgi:ketosteroid isomerase-like protein
MTEPAFSDVDARAIEHLVYAYAERIDAGDFEGVADLFRHGRLVPAPGASPLEGPAEVRSLYEATTRLHDDGTPRTKHVTTNVVVEPDGDGATARSYFTVLQQTEVLPLQPVIAGRYRDAFHRVDGEWWFRRREILVDLVGDLSQHLLFELK